MFSSVTSDDRVFSLDVVATSAAIEVTSKLSKRKLYNRLKYRFDVIYKINVNNLKS